jgi:hypothetical protein
MIQYILYMISINILSSLHVFTAIIQYMFWSGKYHVEILIFATTVRPVSNVALLMCVRH